MSREREYWQDWLDGDTPTPHNPPPYHNKRRSKKAIILSVMSLLVIFYFAASPDVFFDILSVIPIPNILSDMIVSDVENVDTTPNDVVEHVETIPTDTSVNTSDVPDDEPNRNESESNTHLVEIEPIIVEVNRTQPDTTSDNTPPKTDNSNTVTDIHSITKLRNIMLDMINAERTKVGLNTVKLGNNTAAQNHANSMLENCFSGHWGVDGLKPYMRYSIAGGYQNNKENVSGLDYCIKEGENYMETQPEREVAESVPGFMTSPGHRDNILDPHHKFVNIGISWDKHNMKIVQHFEYDYATFFKKPSITDGVLSFTITTKNGAIVPSDSSVVILYDPPPRTLTRGQVANTYCYEWGILVASILEPPPPGSYYQSTQYQQNHSTKCPDPYYTPSDVLAPHSVGSAQAAYDRAKEFSQTTSIPITNVVPYIIADRWGMTPNKLNLSADVSSVLEKHGSGVYTVIVWGTAKGVSIPISSSSLFYTAN